jgi:3-hydroxyacyl-CoA dehydrogenase/enoyl-CoA hydratase/3-hydroxybutyryl-CoA epimerase
MNQLNQLDMYKHWRLESDTDKVLWLYFDKQNTSVNTIDREVMTEFTEIIDSIDQHASALIITSAKKSGFIAGADISQFTKFKDIEEAHNVLIQGQTILNKLESLKVPTIALIDGFCLGGGLELALACRYRIAEESTKTRIGLPEVKLGIHPGWGGTVRLPRLIGAVQGLNLILSGHTISGKAAAKLGLVDVAVPKRQLVHAAKFYASNKPSPHQASALQKLTNSKIIRPLLGHLLRKKLKQ